MKEKKVTHRIVKSVEQKRCPTCKKWKPLDLFHKHHRTSDGLQFKCKRCRMETMSKYKQKIRDLCFEHYGGYKCAWPGCNVTDPRGLTLDHINNDATKMRGEMFPNSKHRQAGLIVYRWLIKHNFPPKYKLQVLCGTHQLIKENIRCKKEVKERRKNL